MELSRVLTSFARPTGYSVLLVLSACVLPVEGIPYTHLAGIYSIFVVFYYSWKNVHRLAKQRCSSFQSKLFLQLTKLCIDTTSDVLRELFRSEISTKHNGHFEYYLDSKKHVFYHQWNTICFCCECLPTGCTFKKSKYGDKRLFEIFFVMNGKPINGHLKLKNKRIEEYCLHAFNIRPDICLEKLDTSALVLLLKESGFLNQKQLESLEKISYARNFVCHAAKTDAHSEKEISSLLGDIELALLNLAEQSCKPFLREQINLMKKVDFDRDDVERLNRKLDEIRNVVDNIKSNNNLVDSSKIKDLERNLTSTFDRGMEGVREEIKIIADNINDRENTLALYFGSFEKRIESLEVKMETVAAHNTSDLSCGEKHNVPGSKVKAIIKIPSGQIDERKVIETLNNSMKQDDKGNYELLFVRKECVIVEISLCRNVLNDASLFRETFNSLLELMVKSSDTNENIVNPIRMIVFFKEPINKDEIDIIQDSLVIDNFQSMQSYQSASTDESKLEDDEVDGVFRDTCRFNDSSHSFSSVSVQVDLIGMQLVHTITQENRQLKSELSKMHEVIKKLKKKLIKFESKGHTYQRKKKKLKPGIRLRRPIALSSYSSVPDVASTSPTDKCVFRPFYKEMSSENEQRITSGVSLNASDSDCMGLTGGVSLNASDSDCMGLTGGVTLYTTDSDYMGHTD